MLDEYPQKLDAGLSPSTALSRRESVRKTLRTLPGEVFSRLWAWGARLVIAVAVVAAALHFGPRLLLGPVVTTVPVVRADLVQSVVASGHVEAPFRVSIGSQITGVVAEVPVAEGQSVRAGDTLIVLDDRESRAAVSQIEGVVAQAQARMRQLRELTLPAAEENLKQAQATLLNAQQAYDRAATLASHGYGTKAALSDATKALDIARAQLRSAEFQVFTNRPGGSDYVMAETQLNQARSSLASAQSRLGYTRITAPRDGVLISRNVERGNVVQPSNGLMQLSPFVETQIVVLIDEKNLGLIQLGQKALASADAFAKERFTAEIVYINPGIDIQRASVQVKLRVPEPPSYLRQDMTVSVDIETARHAAALIIPAVDVRGVATASPWVLAVNSGRVVRMPVRIGIIGGGKAEIIEGLAEGDLIIPATVTVSEGAKVRTGKAIAKSS